VKSLVVKMHAPGPKTMRVHSTAKGPITADMIEADPAVEIINRDLVLATLSENIEFEMEMEVNTGRGYVAAEEMMPPDDEQEIGRIYIDASFSPVTRVRYSTEDTRVGQKTNYDRLVLEIWTNGTIMPEMALVEAGKILRKHLNPFVEYFDLGGELPVSGQVEAAGVQVDQKLSDKLARPVADLELSVRASNCLETAQLHTVGQLVKMTEADLLRVRSFGKTSLREVKRKLADWGLSLGMNVDVSMPAESAAPQADEGQEEQQ
jgi:DNA-directed RNA polymerase subunit alpha